MPAKKEPSEIEHFATLIMGELQRIDAKIDDFQESVDTRFTKLENKVNTGFSRMESEFLSLHSELRSLRTDVNYVVEQSKNYSGFSKEIDLIRSNQTSLEKRLELLESR